MKALRLLVITILFSQISYGQTWQDTVSLIERTFSQYQSKNPGCQLSISRNGQIIFSKAWGMADLERNIPLSVNSILEGGSVSKQFTAAAILLLEQQGKLSLDDDVRKYVPELPDYGSPIKLRYMLHHTSGLRDWGSIAELTGWPRGKKAYTNEDALEIIARQKHLNNAPGDEFIYSNSNYNLFAIIVQRVSGLTLAAFTRKYIFEPAGMTHTQWRDDPNRIVPNRAIAYSKSDSSYETDMPNEYVYGHGGLLTTTEDLLKWNNFYQQGKLGTPSLLSKQTRTESLNNGETNPYAAGLFIQMVMGWNNISHSGATASYRAYLETFPELNLSFALLSNTSQFNINDVAASVSKLFVKDKTEKSTKNATGMQLSDAILTGFSGLYRNERDASTFSLSVKNKKLILDNQLPLVAVSENTFAAGNFLLEITGTGGLYIPGSPKDTIHFTKVYPANLSQKDLDIYSGKYFSEETNSSVTIRHTNDSLLIHLKPGEDHPLTPTYKDAFKIDALDGDLQFIRSADNKILIMKMNVSRARNVEFKKLE
jgi:CubicO group peptidase (beta-lactamase class C family)